MYEIMQHDAQCRFTFRMSATQIIRLHDLLTARYGLSGTSGFTSMEAVGLFLYMMSGESNRDANSFFTRSSSTISRYFNSVLASVNALAADILKPVDHNFVQVHDGLLAEDDFRPFYGAVGAVDGTHVEVLSPGQTSSQLQHRNRHHQVTSKNVLVICDLDGRVLFCDAGWPGSFHDRRVLSDAIDCRAHRFPSLPLYFLGDSGYPCKMGVLPPIPGFPVPRDRRQSRARRRVPEGREHRFNDVHASLRSVIRRQLGIAKEEWRILERIPHHPDPGWQPRVIRAAFTLHNFSWDSRDPAFMETCPLYNGSAPVLPACPPFSYNYFAINSEEAMAALRGLIADALMRY
ncbi:putative nuclease HARBI1 [Oryza brachyantha]|uniref:putative nuclease HARBI1 n=1 Tax=Oryza brachyantha TaxID=4533 RepID=UPI001ADAA55D|nr:putative nuclease HARBI1 [Oryza brachyantha]